MRQLHLLLVCLAALPAFSQSDNHLIWSDKTVYVDYVKSDTSTCSSVTYGAYETWYDGLFSEVRTTILTHNDTVQIYSLEELDRDHSWEWVIIRYTGPGAPDFYYFPTDTVEYAFTKASAVEDELYDKYAILLYHKYPLGFSLLSDLTYFYILDEKIALTETFHYGFDAADVSGAPADDWGRYKNIRYPTFSGSANQRMDLHDIKEKVDGACVYPAYLSQAAMGPGEASPRDGTGSMHVWNPDKGETLGMRETFDTSGCPSYDQHYDHCADPCGINAFTVDPNTYSSPAESHSAKIEANVFPNHQIGDSYFYGFSFMIPSDFDETGMADSLAGFGTARYHILAEFHQSPWPVDESVFGTTCQSSMQLVYLGHGKVGLQYGLQGYNRCGFGPWDYTPGTWMDVVVNIGWGQVRDPADYPGGWTAEQGCLEIWLNDNDAGYEKQCLIPATNGYRSHRSLGTKPTNIGSFTSSHDDKALFGPNLENVNPPYFSLLSMRGDNGGVQPMDFESHVFFDELRIGASLDDVRIPGSTVLDEALLDCSKIVVPAANRSMVLEESFTINAFPNPAGELVTIQVPIELPEAGLLRVVDATGREVYQERLPGGYIPEYQTVLPTAHLPAGMYVVEAIQGERRHQVTLGVKH